MPKRTYLEKYNDENNPCAIATSINKKIIKRILLFVLCSLIYIVITVVSKQRNLHAMQTQFINSFIDIIMNASLLVSIFGIIALVLILVSKKIRENLDQLRYGFKKALFAFLDWAVILPSCATIAAICFTFFFTFAEVDGPSMLPTVENGDNVLVNYLDKVDRYDVVVAYITKEDNIITFNENKYPEYYIKRVIGLPGDELTWQSGVLTINGEVIDEYYFDDKTINDHKLYCNNPFDGIFSYKENGEVITTRTIPEGYYFVMGDNRNNSTDSRMIGLIPEKNIEGVVKFRMQNFITYKKVI